MNKIVASLGIAALGVSATQVASAQGAATVKPWSVSATLRGFYDDNPNTIPDSHPDHEGSFGFEVSPKIGVDWARDATSASLSYTYSGKYYGEKLLHRNDQWTHTHIFSAGLDHAFSERYRIALRDSFVIGQEPDILRSPAASTTDSPLFVSGDNIRNYASVVFNAELTPVFGLELGYDNAFFDYDNDGETSTAVFPFLIPSYSGVLDRVEQSFHVNARWRVLPQTVGYVGYRFSDTDYTGDELIAVFPAVIESEDRNRRSHFGYVGLEHAFRPDLLASGEVGVEYGDYYNDPNGNTETSPYGRATLTYSYLPGSFLRGGLVHRRSATDLVSPSGGSFVLDSQTTVLFAHLRHMIIPSLHADVTGTFQNSEFNGGSIDGETEQFYMLGLQLEYQINPFLATHVGYNFDNLESDIRHRGYDRNRVYIGLRASY